MKIFFSTIGVAIALWLLIFPGWLPGYSEGQRTGDIYKFSKKGIFWKSWEGEMYLGGIHSTGGETPRLELDRFYFSIPESQEDEKKLIIEQIKECSEARKPCTIVYKEWLKAPITQGSSYEVIDVEIAWE